MAAAESFKTPILFMIFNRPSTTRIVFDEIRKIKPEKLFIVADGPREGKLGEKEKCEMARKITEQVNWPCDVQRNYSKVNLGCAKRISSGISWFFEHVTEGIILEDDCLPHPDFFSYCAEMLERYRDSKEVMFIGGDNFQDGKKWGEASYYFSAYFYIWGYAMWKKTWDTYDFTLYSVREDAFEAAANYYFSDESQKKFLVNYLRKVKGDADITTWDAHLFICLWSRRALAVVPNVNLVSNIGFGEDATHTQDIDSNYSNLLTSNILPLVHPREITLCREADLRYHELSILTLPKKVMRKISRIIHSQS